MNLFKVSIIFFLALAAAEKKIELQDIEEDNLKSEKQKDDLNTEARSQTGSVGLVPLEFLKSGLLRYFESTPTSSPRYVQQYAVTEQPEETSLPVTPKPRYNTPGTQAMVGYLSNVPMQIYLVPQYYNAAQDSISNTRNEILYSTSVTPHAPNYQQHEAVQSQANYIQVPASATPTAKTFVQQYTAPGFSYTHPTVVPQANTAPVLTYQIPVVQYQPVSAANPSKEYYHSPQYTDNNPVDTANQHEGESSSHTEVTYEKAPVHYTRFFSTKTPSRDEYRHSTITELPHPNPILLKSPPPHLSHLPKSLPMYRPYPKPLFTPSASVLSSSYTSRPSEAYGAPFKRRPTSLLDSYIPSHVQIEYIKRGFAKDPLEAYEALSSARNFIHSHAPPRQYERGFLPNQLYHTAAGGVTFGHLKRTPKVDKVVKK